MRRASLSGIAVVLGWAICPASAHAAGIWLTLAGGPDRSSATSSAEFWFDTPHGPPPIVVNQLTGAGIVEAGTAGGTSSFGSLGTPVLLNVADGSAYVSGGFAPAAAKTPKGGPQSSTGPQAGGTVPPDAALLGITLSDPDSSGFRTLTADLLGIDGTRIGGTANVPDGGWWVIGLTPAESQTPPDGGGGGDGGGDGSGGGGTGGGGNGPPTEVPGEGGTPTTPEPSTLVLLGVAAGAGSIWRARRREGK